MYTLQPFVRAALYTICGACVFSLIGALSSAPLPVEAPFSAAVSNITRASTTSQFWSIVSGMLFGLLLFSGALVCALRHRNSASLIQKFLGLSGGTDGHPALQRAVSSRDMSRGRSDPPNESQSVPNWWESQRQGGRKQFDVAANTEPAEDRELMAAIIDMNVRMRQQLRRGRDDAAA